MEVVVDAGELRIKPDDPRQDDADGLAVDDAVVSGERVRHAVRRAEHGILDGQPRIRRAELHPPTRCEVGRVGEDLRERGGAKPECLARKERAERRALAGNGGLDGVRQRINARASRDTQRLAEREHGVEDGDASGGFRVEARHLLVRRFIGDERRTLALAAGARRRRDGDEREHRLRRFPHAPIVAHLAAVREDEIRAFRCIHAAPTANPDEDVRPTRSLHAPGDVARRRVLPHPVEHRHREPRRAQEIARFPRVARCDDAGIRDDERPLAETRREFADARQRSRTHDEACAELPIEGG